MPSPGDFVIATHDLRKSFGDVQALRHSKIGFPGPNGAGKTTTVR